MNAVTNARFQYPSLKNTLVFAHIAWLVPLAVGLCLAACEGEREAALPAIDISNDRSDIVATDVQETEEAAEVASCDGVSCGEHGACEVRETSAVCICDAGYAGSDCQACDVGYRRGDQGGCVGEDDCTEFDPCGDNGTCSDESGIIACLCDLGYTGRYCETCYPGYHDDGSGACLLDQQCMPASCSGRGECSDESGTISCTCDDGYGGDACEACIEAYHRNVAGQCVPDESCAADDPCGEHGTCDDAAHVIVCICDDGYAGLTCSSCYAGYHANDDDQCVLDQ